MAGNLIALVSESNGVNLAYVAGLFIAKGLCFFFFLERGSFCSFALSVALGR